MDQDRAKLLAEARKLDKKIKSFNLTEDQRKRERVELLHKYNETKDSAQKMLGALAELECLSTGVLYKKMNLSFEP